MLRGLPSDQNIKTEVTIWLTYWWWLALIVSIILLIIIVIFFKKTFAIWQEQHERVYGRPDNIVEEIKKTLAVEPPAQNEAWEKIIKLMASDSPNDWKLAIIEADKMLELVIGTFKIPGDNLGEKLKKIEKGDFLSLEEAWSAHKIRNRIAHEHNFHLSHREAQTAISNYEKVFREFDFI